MAHTNMDAGRNSREINMATNIELLRALMALNAGDLPPLPRPAPSAPIPYAPVPNLGPLSTETTAAYGALNPEPVPPRFIQPTLPDTSLINQEVGPAPRAPAPLSRGQRIANALQGFGAGVSGNGAQFLAQLQEPQREYQRQLERYQGRRTEALDRAERRAEREAAQANRANELVYERDYKMWLQKNDIRGDAAKEAGRQAFTLLLEANRAEREEKRELARERREREADAKVRTGRFFTASKNMALSTELGRYYAGLSDKPLSAAAAKLDAQLQNVQQARMNRAARVGGGGASSGDNLVDEFNTLKQMAIDRVKARGGQPDEEIEAIEKATRNVVNRMAKKRNLYEIGIGQGGYPYAQRRGAKSAPAAQPAAQAVEISRADVREFMQLSGIKDEKEARRQLEAAGGIMK